MKVYGVRVSVVGCISSLRVRAVQNVTCKVGRDKVLKSPGSSLVRHSRRNVGNREDPPLKSWGLACMSFGFLSGA